MGIREMIERRLSDLAAKATQPGALYSGGSRGNGVPVYPQSFGGWPDRGGTYYGGGTDQATRKAQAAAINAWVYSDITAIGNELVVSELRVQRRDGEETTDEVAHPFEALWNHPNPHMSRVFLMQYWTWQLKLFGEAYLYLAPRGRDLVEVWPVPSSMIRPEGDEQEFIKHFVFQAGPEKPRYLIDPAYICYSRTPNPFDTRRGMAPLDAFYGAVATDASMTAWNTRFFDKSNAVPSAVISVAKDTQDIDFVTAREEIKEFFGGTRRGALITRAGDIDVKLLSYGHKDMDFLAGREMTRAEIDRVMGFPEGYWAKDATRANSEGAKATMIENAVYPLLVMLQEDLTAQVMPRWYGDHYQVQFDDIRPRNRELEIREIDMFARFHSIDEVRTKYYNTGKRADEDTAPKASEPLVADIQMGIVGINDRRAQLGLPLVDDTDDKARRELTAKLDLFNRAAERLPLEVAARLVGLEIPVIDAPPSASPAPTPAPPAMVESDEDDAIEEDDMDDESQKAADRRRWQDKAIKSLKRGKGASVTFAPEALSDDEAGAIREALAAAATVDAIKAAFTGKAKTKPAPEEITPADIKRGLSIWDEVMGDDFAGLLDASIEE